MLKQGVYLAQHNLSPGQIFPLTQPSRAFHSFKGKGLGRVAHPAAAARIIKPDLAMSQEHFHGERGYPAQITNGMGN